jgi:hypothetical protein
VAAPGVVASASGLAKFGEDGLRLSGRGRRPRVAGTLVFDPPPVPEAKPGQRQQAPASPIAVIPRGVRRELSFIQGSIDIATCAPDSKERFCPTLTGDHRAYQLFINDVDVSIEGEGHIRNITGPASGAPAITLIDGVATSADITFDAENVPFRTPNVDLIVSAHDINVALDNDHSPWRVSGPADPDRVAITVVDGKFKRNFELTDQITSLGTTTAPITPPWEEYPTVGKVELENLKIAVNRFAISNNIAQIDLGGDLHLSNTIRDPRLEGEITVRRGEFKIPGTRAQFTRTNGSIRFIDKADNPELGLTSIADYRDLSGQDHEITLKITNRLDQLQWDLTTSTGYDKSQTLALLLLGRNPDQLRRSLGDQSLGADPTRVDPSTNPSQGFTDQIVKDLAGDWVSDLLGNSLKELTGLDVFRVAPGFGSLNIYGEKKVSENVKLVGDSEWTILGRTYNARVELSTPFRFFSSEKISVQGSYLNKDFYDPAEIDQLDWQAKLVFRLFIP